jgi:hypothetical protein
MGWVNAFLASWYSVAYASGGIFSMSLACWTFTRNPTKHELINRQVAGFAVKTWVAVLLIALSAAAFYGAYQVTAFERYFVVKKMPVY